MCAAPANSTETGANVTTTSALPGFMTSKTFAVNFFLGSVFIFSLPFVHHAFMAGADFIADGQAEHPVFSQAGNITAFYLMAWHMVFGAMMNFISPYQVYLGLSRKKKAWHKYIGMSNIAIAFFGATVGSLYFSLYYDENVGVGLQPYIYQPGAMYGVVMFYVIYKLIQTLVRRDFVAHKEWAIRLFILAIGSWLFRVTIGMYATGHTIGLGGILPGQTAFGIFNSWGFYVTPLVIYEVYLRLRRAGHYDNLPSYAPFVTSMIGSGILLVGSGMYVLMMYAGGSSS